MPPMMAGGPDTTVKFTVEVASVTVAQHIEGRGEPSNAVLDLSVSAGHSFSRSEGVAELLDETGVSLRGWIATVDG